MEFDPGDGSGVQEFDGVKSVRHTYQQGENSPVIRVYSVDELDLPPSEWTPDSSIVVRPPLPEWVSHLKWAIPSLLALGIVGFVGTRQMFAAAEQRNRMMLSGVLNVSRKSKRPVWQLFELSLIHI